MNNEKQPKKQTWAILSAIIIGVFFLIAGIISPKTVSKPKVQTASNVVNNTNNNQIEVVTQYENKIKELKEEIEELNGNLSIAQNQILDLQNENDILKEQIIKLEEEKQTLTTQIDTLKNQSNSSNTPVSDNSNKTTTKATSDNSTKKATSSNSNKPNTTSTTSSSKLTTSSASSSNDTQSKTVYITNTGTKYHSSSCSYLKKSKKAISLNSAKSQGYTPCSKCNP